MEDTVQDLERTSELVIRSGTAATLVTGCREEVPSRASADLVAPPESPFLVQVQVQRVEGRIFGAVTLRNVFVSII